jgi:membrane protease YdiL (CAAX protease family)
MDIAEFGKLDFSKTHFFENFTNLSGGVAFNTDILDISDLGLFNSLIISSIFLGFSFYLILALGTELGWRGFLTDETKEMGYVNSNVFVGTVWGIWSIPLVLTGLEFTDHQLGGALINIVFCILLSFILSYCRFKTKSILGPASLYGMFYSIQGLYILYNNDGNPVFASIKGVAGLIVLSLAIYLIFKLDPKFIFYYGREQEAPPEENHEKLE